MSLGLSAWWFSRVTWRSTAASTPRSHSEGTAPLLLHRHSWRKKANHVPTRWGAGAVQVPAHWAFRFGCHPSPNPHPPNTPSGRTVRTISSQAFSSSVLPLPCFLQLQELAEGTSHSHLGKKNLLKSCHFFTLRTKCLCITA